MRTSQRPARSGRASGLAVEGVRNSRPALKPIPQVRAVEFIRRMRGASQPHLLRCEDGENYVVKFQNNPQHVRVLANELLCARLAAWMGLPVPGAAFVDVPVQLIAGNPPLELDLGPQRQRCAPGLHFGSRFPGMPGQTLVVDFLPDRLLRRVHNFRAVFLGGLVFDKWTCNCDGRQVIYYRSPKEEKAGYAATLLDHGFCFNDGGWNFPDSPIRSLFPRRVVYESVRGLESFEPFLSREENLEAAEIEECTRNIPMAWCGDRPEALAGLVERLYKRRRLVRQALIEAKNSSLRPFPHWA